MARWSDDELRRLARAALEELALTIPARRWLSPARRLIREHFALIDRDRCNGRKWKVIAAELGAEHVPSKKLSLALASERRAREERAPKSDP